MTLALINDLTTSQIASICDHTFLNRSEAYKGAAKKKESPVRLRESAFESFLRESVSDQNKQPYAVCVRPEDVRGAFQFFYMSGFGTMMPEVKVATMSMTIPTAGSSTT